LHSATPKIVLLLQKLCPNASPLHLYWETVPYQQAFNNVSEVSIIVSETSFIVSEVSIIVLETSFIVLETSFIVSDVFNIVLRASAIEQ
jgi:hypothetical protein